MKERRRGVYVTSVSMNTECAKIKANKFLNNFVYFSQFALRREMKLGNINSKSICLLNHNIQVFRLPFGVGDLVNKDTRDIDQICSPLC